MPSYEVLTTGDGATKIVNNPMKARFSESMFLIEQGWARTVSRWYVLAPPFSNPATCVGVGLVVLSRFCAAKHRTPGPETMLSFCLRKGIVVHV